MDIVRDSESVTIIDRISRAGRGWQLVSRGMGLVCVIFFLPRLWRNAAWAMSVPEWVWMLAWVGLIIVTVWGTAMLWLQTGTTVIFSRGQIEQIWHSDRGDRRGIIGTTLDEIRFINRRLDGPDLFMLRLRYMDGGVLATDWMRSKTERDDIARQLATFYPDAEIDWERAA